MENNQSTQPLPEPPRAVNSAISTLQPTSPSPIQTPTENPVVKEPGNKGKKGILIVVILVVIAALAVAGYLFYQNTQRSAVQINSFEACMTAAGSRIQESYPKICVAKDGQQFTQEIIEPQESQDFTDQTETWQLYTNQEFQFSFKYPADWFTSTSGDGTILFDDTVIDGQNIVEPDQVAITVEVITNPKLIAAYEADLSNSQTKRVINGIEFILTQPKFSGEGQPPKQVSFAETKHNGNLIRFGLSDAVHQDTFNQILSTFEFIEN